MVCCKKTPAQDIFFENESPSSLTGEVYQATQDSFCDNESHELLKIPRLLSTLNYIDHVDNVNKIMLMLSALLCGSILENRLYHSGQIKNPRKLVLIWYVGDSCWLMPFRSNSVDYVKYDIPVKDITKINRVIGIGTILHK